LWYNVRMKLKGTNLSPPLSLLAALACAAIAWTAHALPAVRPALPPVANPDTETVTNLAFGTDANGDGELSDGEVALLAGWDCGELLKGSTWARRSAR